MSMSGFVDDFFDQLPDHVENDSSSTDKANILKKTVATLYPNTKIGQVTSAEHAEAVEGLEAVCATLAASARSHNGPTEALPSLGSFLRAALNGLRRGLGLNDDTEGNNDVDMYPAGIDDSQQKAHTSSGDDGSEDSDADMEPKRRRISILQKQRAEPGEEKTTALTE